MDPRSFGPAPDWMDGNGTCHVHRSVCSLYRLGDLRLGVYVRGEGETRVAREAGAAVSARLPIRPDHQIRRCLLLRK
jgi:hypothetical protein